MATKGFKSIQQRYNDSSLTVRISGGTSLFKGVLVDDFTLNGSSSWSGDTQSSGTVQGIIHLFSDSKVQTAFASTVSWDGSERPTFTVNMIVPALTAQDDVTAKCKSLYDLVYPQSVGAVITSPPLGFHTNVARTKVSKGAITVGIGTWFRASGLVSSEVNITYSKQLTKRQKPLFATVAITFMAAVMPSSGTVKSYFL